MAFVTRFAPSPTGPLHLGHACSAILGHDLALGEGGRFLLRIEDIDQSRSRVEWEQQIYDDLQWLGLRWEMPVLRQSDNLDPYATALGTLAAMGLTYICNCQRADIRAALAAPQETTTAHGPDGLVYPGTCRDRNLVDATSARSIRLNMARAMTAVQGSLTFSESGPQPRMLHGTTDDMLAKVGDIVLSRHSVGTSYHLSVVIDDAGQGITHVTRGEDLRDATFIHVLLQKLLGLATPLYFHHRLIRDETGKRLAKRDNARSIASYRSGGATPGDIRRMIGL